MKTNLFIHLLLFSLFFPHFLFSQFRCPPTKIDKKVMKLQSLYDLLYTNNTLSEEDFNLKNQLEEEINDHFSNNTINYKHTTHKNKKLLTGISIQSDNDMFAIFDNKDHEYTGSVKVEVLSDYLNSNFFTTRKKLNWLSYNSLFLGIEAYTPIVLEVDSLSALNEKDRPFASFQYLGKSRQIIDLNGKKRFKSNFRVGIIGGRLARRYQMILHNDISPKAEVNTGWNYQIGSGGRLAIQYDLFYDRMLKEFFGQHIFQKTYGGIGLERAYIALGFGISNKNFLEKNHHGIVKMKKWVSYKNVWEQVKNSFYYEVDANLEVVGTNTMLEGYWADNRWNIFTKSTEKDIVPVIENIEHFVGRFSCEIGLRTFNTTLSYKFFILTPEYDYSWKDGKNHHKYARIKVTYSI